MIDTDPFVGREPELTLLRDAFELARAGNGGVVLVSGEAGIGKTRLVRELEGGLEDGESVVLWGRSHDIGGARPYWPWVQVLEALTRAAEVGPHRDVLGGAGGLRTLLGPSSSALGGVVPVLAGAGAEVGTGQESTPESGRFELFTAVERLLRGVAAKVPVLIALDDLQWADASSLALLEFLAASLVDERVLVAATCRDVEAGVLGQTLGVLARSPNFRTINLAGLSVIEVNQYLDAGLTSDGPASLGERSGALAPALHDRTGGNPFFVREIAQAMSRGGDVGTLPREVPASIRAAIASRLEQLSPGCRDLLRLIAVLGRGVDHALLRSLGDDKPAAVTEQVNEAVTFGLLELTEDGTEQRFVHELMRDTLLHDLSTGEQAALHVQVGAAIEALIAAPQAGRIDGPSTAERQAKLAQQFVAAARVDRSYASQAVRYSEVAGQQAEAVWAWREAIQHYRDALAAVGGLADAPVREAQLLTSLGRALRDGREPVEAGAVLQEAVDRYRALEDGHGLALAAATFRLVKPARDDERSLIREALVADDGRDPAITAELLMRLSRLWDDHEARAAAREAERLADLHAVVPVKCELVYRRALFTFVSDGLDAAEPLFEETHRWAIAAGDLTREYSVLATLAALNIRSGRLAAAEHRLAELSELVTARRDASGFGAIFDSHYRSLLAFLRAERTPPSPFAANPTADVYATMHRAARLELDGDAVAAAALFEVGTEPVMPVLSLMVPGFAARLRWRAHGPAAAREALGVWHRQLQADSAAFLNSPAIAYAALDDALLELVDRNTCVAAYDHLVSCPEERLAAALGGGLDQLRGRLALHFGKVDEAEHWYRTGAEWAAREHCPIELGRNLAGLAEVAEHRGQRTTAVQHLERAITLVEEHDAKIWLAQFARRLQELRAAPRVGRPRYPDGLTAREVEVLQQLAPGRTNPEIADALHIARGTVARHISNILRKTGCKNRMQARQYAAEHHLLD